MSSFVFILKIEIQTLRLTMESCIVCQDADCTSDTFDLIKDACFDNTILSTQMSIPLSTSTDVNEYINAINSDYNFQLAEFTTFKFPNNPEGKFCLFKSPSNITFQLQSHAIFRSPQNSCLTNTNSGLFYKILKKKTN